MTTPGSAPPPAPATPAAPHAPRVARSRAWRAGIAAALGVTAVVGAVAAGTLWLLATPAGTAWLSARVPGLQTDGVQGSLLDGLTVRRLVWQGATTRVEVDGLQVAPPRIAATRSPRTWGRIDLDAVVAQRVSLHTAPSGEPVVLPERLPIPVELVVARLQVDELRASALTDPLQAIEASMHLSADDGGEHRLSVARLRWRQVTVTGDARLQAEAPMRLAATVTATRPGDGGASAAPSPTPTPTPAPAPAATPLDTAAVSARLVADGPLAALPFTAAVDAAGQSLRAEGTWAAEARWPMTRLALSADRFDLSALLPDAPATSLGGRVDVQPVAGGVATDPPSLQVTAALTNAAPGAWSDRRVPVSRLDARVRVAAAPGVPQAGEVERIDVALASARGDAGTVGGSARWGEGRVEARLALRRVEPALVDARLPAMRLDGTVDATATGLPGTAGAPTEPRLQAELAIDGEQRGATGAVRAPGPVRVRAVVDASPQAVTVERLQLRAGDAQADAELRARRLGPAATAPTEDLSAVLRHAWQAAWSLDGRLQLASFDPGAWVPADPQSPWRRRASRLTGDADLALRWPSDAGTTVAERALGIAGRAALRLSPSTLLGVVAEGDAQVERGSTDAPLAVRVALAAGGNRASAEARFTAGSGPDAGAGDAWSADIDAPSLATLAPWLALADVPAAAPSAGAAPLAGQLRLQARLDGRWPKATTRGQVAGRSLQWADALVGRLDARWTAGPQDGDALQVDADAERLAQGPQRIDRMRLRLDGTWARHRLEASALTRAVPPDWLRTLQGVAAETPPDERSRFSVVAEAGWAVGAPAALDAPVVVPVVAERSEPRPGVAAASAGRLHPALSDWLAGNPTRWWIRGLEADVRAQRGERADGPVWVTARSAPIEIGLPGRADAAAATGAEAPLQARTGAGRIEAAGTVLRWDRLGYRAASAGRPAALEADGVLEPVAVAPLLARLQPGFGWGGDLEVGGRFTVRAAPPVRMDVRLERRGGDLTVDEGPVRQPLGLSALAATLEVRDGRWLATYAAEGRRLGSVQGRLAAPVPGDRPWPAPDAAVEGRVQLQVADLGVWGAWVPAGWRLGGRLQADATIGGRFDAPTLTGSVRGDELAVRNPLQGVSVHDGTVAVTLQGERARIDTLRARAGAGTVEITGGMSFGADPSADLQVVAERFELLRRVDRRLVVSGQSRVRLGDSRVAVNGRYGVDEGLFDVSRGGAPTLSDDVVVVGGDRAGFDEPPPVAPDPARRPLRADVDLRVDLGERLRVRGRGLDTGLRGSLRLTTPDNRLAVDGTVRTVDGTYAAYGQRLVIGRGNLVFTGPPANPRLDIEATRPNLDVQVGVTITGFAASPRVRLFSEPEMSEMEKLSWLMLGRESDGLGSTDVALLQRAAFALLAGADGGSQDPISALLGLDTLSVGQTTQGETRATVVSLGKQLNRLWYVGYERNLNATAGTFQLIYRLARRFTLRAQSGEDNSLDIIWTWRWQ